MYVSCEPVDLFNQSYYELLTKRIESQLQKMSEVKHYEIFCNANQDTKINYEKGEIKDATQKSGGGLGLRVIGAEGREGITFTSDFSEQALQLITNQSIQMMKAATPNPYFIDLAKPSAHYQSIEGTYDPKIVNVCPDDIDELLSPILDLKNKEMKPHSLSGSLSTSHGSIYIWNSNGVKQWEKYTTAGCNVELSLRENGVPSTGFNWQTVCQLDDLDVPIIAKNCYQMALRGIHKKSINSGKYPILLSPLAVASFLISPLTHAINAERVQNQMSFLGDDLGKPIGNSMLTIDDNPHLPGRIGSEIFDAEGIATKPLTIVKEGILEEFYHNTLTAGKAKTISNGHASRGSYLSGVGIGNFNVIMKNGNDSLESIMEGIDKGIYFEYSGDSPNYITGDFSGLIMTGYLIENGQIGPALLETLISVNLRDVYKSIKAVSKERTWIDEIYAPYVLLDTATISSRE